MFITIEDVRPLFVFSGGGSTGIFMLIINIIVNWGAIYALTACIWILSANDLPFVKIGLITSAVILGVSLIAVSSIRK